MSHVIRFEPADPQWRDVVFAKLDAELTWHKYKKFKVYGVVLRDCDVDLDAIKIRVCDDLGIPHYALEVDVPPADSSEQE